MACAFYPYLSWSSLVYFFLPCARETAPALCVVSLSIYNFGGRSFCLFFPAILSFSRVCVCVCVVCPLVSHHLGVLSFFPICLSWPPFLSFFSLPLLSLPLCLLSDVVSPSSPFFPSARETTRAVQTENNEIECRTGSDASIYVVTAYACG